MGHHERRLTPRRPLGVSAGEWAGRVEVEAGTVEAGVDPLLRVRLELTADDWAKGSSSDEAILFARCLEY